jgi:hypothetical protein
VRDYLPCGLTCNTVQYKSGTRAHIVSTGSNVVLNLGEQFSDIEGGTPSDPRYYLP